MAQTITVEQVMSREPRTVAPEDPIRVAIDQMRDNRCRRLPVVSNGQLVGIVSDRDLRRATNSPFVMRERWYDEFLLDHITVHACMTAHPVTVTPSTALVDAVKLMRERKIGGLPVLDGERLVGIITDTDLMDYLIAILE